MERYKAEVLDALDERVEAVRLKAEAAHAELFRVETQLQLDRDRELHAQPMPAATEALAEERQKARETEALRGRISSAPEADDGGIAPVLSDTLRALP